MGNRIKNTRHPSDGDLKMSNGLTSAFLHILVLNASDLAASDHEKDLVIWFARHNQAVVGIGTVGFDIREIPWSEDFDNEKKFLLRAIDAAMAKKLWDKLDYKPREDWVMNAFAQFRKMIEAFQKDEVDPTRLDEWAEFKPRQFSKCAKHGVYLMIWHDKNDFDECSCIVCSDK